LREEQTKEMPFGPGFIPGDPVEIEMGSLRHQMNLKEVLAVFRRSVAERNDESDPPYEITLRGRPEERDLPRPHFFEDSKISRDSKVSRVTLSATVPPDAMPGEYQCQRLEAETFAGRRVPFDPHTEATWRSWRFRVQEEPETPPTF
jgi:hypothetical protein